MAKQKEQWFPAKGEKGVTGRFGMHKHLDAKASRAADTEIYKEILVLYTRVAGDVDEPSAIKVHPRTADSPGNQDALANRFPEAWKAWTTNEQVDMPGTPLDALDLEESRIIHLGLFGVYRLEHLAGLSDQQCENIGFGTKKLRERACEKLGMPTPGRMSNMQPVAAIPQAAPAASFTAADVAQLVEMAVNKALAERKPQTPTPARRGRQRKQTTEEASPRS